MKTTHDAPSTRAPARRSRKGVADKRRVTMTDVAREAGCSQATVSLVLNGVTGIKISAETRDRVIATARALGYGPQNYAHVLGTYPSGQITEGTVGFMVDQLATSPEAVVAIDGARQALWNAGSVLLVGQTMSDPDMERRTIDRLRASRINALIYMTIFTREVALPDELYTLGIPVVLLNCYTADQAFPSVVPSEIAGGQSATDELLRNGHRRIATITGEMWMEAAQDRLSGYRRALATADIPFDEDLVIEGDWSASAGFDATTRLLRSDMPPTAIFCQNDRMAIGCFDAIKEAGLRIPADISVVGYDDEEISRHMHPQLTTCVLPHRAMGQWAVETSEAALPAGDQRYPITKLECTLIRRASVGPPRQSGGS